MPPKLIRPKEASSVRRSSELEELINCCDDEWLINKIQETEGLLKKNRELGVKIPRRLQPKSYIDKWGINNLYKCDLGPDWRMTYTLLSDGVGIAVVTLEVLTHKKYNKLFGYRTT